MGAESKVRTQQVVFYRVRNETEGLSLEAWRKRWSFAVSLLAWLTGLPSQVLVCMFVCFYVGVGDLNLGPLACTSVILATKPSPISILNILNICSKSQGSQVMILKLRSEKINVTTTTLV